MVSLSHIQAWINITLRDRYNCHMDLLQRKCLQIGLDVKKLLPNNPTGNK